MQPKNTPTIQETSLAFSEDEKHPIFQAGVFRQEAMQHYIQQQGMPMPSDFMRMRFFLPLWLALGTLWLIIIILGILLVLSTSVSLLDISRLQVLG